VTEIVKKIVKTIQGKPEGTVIFGDEPFVANLNHVEFKILRNGTPINELKPVFACVSCGKELDEKWVKREVSMHGITQHAVQVDKHGEKNARLIEFTKEVKNKKLSATEAFVKLDNIVKLYSDLPKDERDVTTVSNYISLKCPECESPLGNIDIYVYAKPETVTYPDVADYVALPKTTKELRLIREYLQLPKDMDFDSWLAGKDVADWKEKLSEWSNEIEKLRFLRTLQKPVSNMQSAIRASIEAIDDEIKTRSSRTYNLLKEPPELAAALEHAKQMKSEIELERGQKEFMKELGAKPIRR
jgi:hypothetical protein